MKEGGKYVDPNKAFVIHEDMIDFFTHYAKEHGMTFEQVRAMRDELVAQGIPYWNTDHDAEMLETALERTLLARSQGWRFPEKNGGK